MNQVDWSKAPEDDVRYNSGVVDPWLRRIDGKVEYFDDGKWVPYLSTTQGDDHWCDATERPSPAPAPQMPPSTWYGSVTAPTPKRYYIAGPITGYESTYRDVFNAMDDTLSMDGHTVLNPATLPAGLTQDHYMDICIAMLRCVTHVMMLKGWERSEGARIEHSLAIKNDLIVEYER